MTLTMRAIPILELRPTRDSSLELLEPLQGALFAWARRVVPRCAVGVVFAFLLLLGFAERVMSEEGLPELDVRALFSKAQAEGRVGVARKSRPADARPAKAGEVVVTFILGEGVETRSKPAVQGDWVVRNRCANTGNEEYLVKADAFAGRYQSLPGEPDLQGWRAVRPRGREVRYFIVQDLEGSFHFPAPWGELMVAHPGDAIVQDPANPSDTYRVAKGAFECSYEIVTPG